MKHHLTPGEAAERLGVHVSTLNRWADAGHLETYRTPGGHRRFRVSDVNRMAGEVRA
jgi:excisionase family DNA binding protein